MRVRGALLRVGERDPAWLTAEILGNGERFGPSSSERRARLHATRTAAIEVEKEKLRKRSGGGRIGQSRPGRRPEIDALPFDLEALQEADFASPVRSPPQRRAARSPASSRRSSLSPTGRSGRLRSTARTPTPPPSGRAATPKTVTSSRTKEINYKPPWALRAAAQRERNRQALNDKAALMLQSAQRAKRARGEVAVRWQERKRLDQAAAKLQTCQRRKVRREQQRESAAMAIESAWRGKRARRQASAKREVRAAKGRAASTLQACQRRKLKAKARVEAAAVLLATLRSGAKRKDLLDTLRQVLASAATAKLLTAQKDAVVRIQAGERARRARGVRRQLEEHRQKVARRVSPLKWERIGRQRPTYGTEVFCKLLRDALKRKTEFRGDELKRFGFKGPLLGDSFINVDGMYYEPCTVAS